MYATVLIKVLTQASRQTFHVKLPKLSGTTSAVFSVSVNGDNCAYPKKYLRFDQCWLTTHVCAKFRIYKKQMCNMQTHMQT